MINLIEKMEDFKNTLDDDLLDLFSEMVDYDSNDYIDDIVHYVSDANVDIYTSQLLNWAFENYTYIDDAINEYGINDKMDFLDIIRQGQYYYYNYILYINREEFIRYYILKYLIDYEFTINENEFDDLMSDYCYYKIDKLQDIENFINNNTYSANFKTLEEDYENDK